ncbi:DNA polymerase IV [Dasania sp. GY-MA-18]|uniref:DNA polymerase IV n=1 Tax=Dasania phycosphaerae TaxID=2950436 RepID=A0A9J6RQJ3_9GAMM|nr:MULTISPECIES: DNA polymerase IV [Dasania]MCR8924053.1 DNA polymerase IV [Dasania sp. GY-MA-18]MCZ0866626.1 DNA polymerase IV [Dasania phycosphaerae]MCZ0870211.1 DNA polymerase IV [Dasania phycosphaerae]
MLNSATETSLRKIIHCDCDCFFAAIEMRDDPLLRGRPMAVGGSSDKRGVISTCNYEARAYGVHSAMATAHAKKLCPDLLVVPHNMAKYRLAAQQIRDIFYDYTDAVEPVSLDEAYLDVSASSACQGSATLIAKEIMARVHAEVGITLSAGVAGNKFLAKIGSDWNKPNGLCVILPQQVADFVVELPVAKINGVGKVTAEKLQRLGVQRCGDLQAYTVFELVELFGAFGQRLYKLCRGEDDRPVKVSRQRKSLSVEHTYPEDKDSLSQCLQQLPALFAQLNQRLEGLEGSYLVTKQFVKFKFSDFQTTTVECVVAGSIRLSVYHDLFQQAFERGAGLGVRLLGLGVRFQVSHDSYGEQLPLFPYDLTLHG